jgi:very-short-patch-repair endonuclease
MGSIPKIHTTNISPRETRHNPTPAENILWQALRHNQLLGLHFRRQHAIHPFIVDFVCLSHHLIIEVDGGIHDLPEQARLDHERQSYLESLGFRVLRFRNEAIMSDLQQVLNCIREAV